jgi:hypothetical protein
MIRLVHDKKMPTCFAGARPAMIMLTLAPPSTAVVSFDHRCDPNSACRDRPIGLVASSLAFQNSIQHTSPAAKSP